MKALLSAFGSRSPSGACTSSRLRRARSTRAADQVDGAVERHSATSTGSAWIHIWALMAPEPPNMRPRGQNSRRSPSAACGSVSYAQSTGLLKSFGNAAGSFDSSGVRPVPASTSRTRRAGSAESRAASTQPAEPPPTITTSTVRGLGVGAARMTGPPWWLMAPRDRDRAGRRIGAIPRRRPHGSCGFSPGNSGNGEPADGAPRHHVTMARLGDDDLARFVRDGYLVVPGVVGEDLLARADDEIDDLVAATPPHQGDGGPGPNLWFPPVARLPRCDDVLRRSAALAIADELVAPARLDHAFDHIQVATTVPPYAHVPGGPHIDGHGHGLDRPFSFTLLAGVFLTDQTTHAAGNLWVWPGSHLAHQRLFHERGARVLEANGGHATLLDPPLALGTPVEVTGGRGDLLLAHYLLGHNKGGNTNPVVRRTIYYRLAVPGHADRWEATFLDAWHEYPRLRAGTGT